MKFPAFDYLRAESVEAAIAALAASKGEARILAGGQSLAPMMAFRVARPGLLVDVSRIAALRACTAMPDGSVRIGAAVTHAAIEDGAVPGPWGAPLARVAGGIAYRAIRNRGTIGGSLCQADPAADWPLVLAALGAEAVLAGPRGERRLPVPAFLRGQLETALAEDELLVAVELPAPGRARHGFAKSVRKAGEYAEALALASVDSAQATVWVGAVGPVPQRIAVDPALFGTADGVQRGTPGYQALRAAVVAEDPYKAHLAAVLGCRAMAEAL